MKNEVPLQLNYVVNEKKYLLFQIPLSSTEVLEKIDKRVTEFNGIIQGSSKVKTNIFSTSYMILNVLIPEDQAIKFSQYVAGIKK